MKLTRKILRHLIRESFRDIVFEGVEADETVESIGAGVDAAAATLKSNYENLVSNLESTIDGIKSQLAMMTFYGVASMGGMGGAGGVASTLYGFPLFSAEAGWDVNLPFNNYEENHGIPPHDVFGGPSLKILENFEEDERDAILKVLKRYYPPLSQSGLIYAAAKGNGLIKLADIYDTPYDDEQKSKAAAEINKIIASDPRAEMIDDGFSMNNTALVKSGWDPSVVLFHEDVVGDILSVAAPVLSSEFDFQIYSGM